MNQPMTLERMSKLLETMEPIDIRRRFRHDLEASEEAQLMLRQFEGLDKELCLLVDSTPPSPR